MQIEPVLESTLTCPACGFSRQETMPLDCCLWYYECTDCHSLLTPLKGDCCVFCSYGSVNCPDVQTRAGCCPVAST